jgi:hypothetical protein
VHKARDVAAARAQIEHDVRNAGPAVMGELPAASVLNTGKRGILGSFPSR